MNSYHIEDYHYRMSKDMKINSRDGAAEAIRKYQYHIASFFLGFVIGGVIFFIITYSIVSNSSCKSYIPIAVIGNSQFDLVFQKL